MVLCAQLPFIWYATWLLSEKIYSLTFWPHPLRWGCVYGPNICYHVAASFISFNLICNMTTFDLLTPPPGSRVSVGKILLPCCCQLHMTIYWKSLILASTQPPKPTQRTKTQAFKLKSRLICFKSIAALPACKISAKNINNCPSYCEIKIFDLWSLRWGQRGWGKTLTLPCLFTGTWQSWSIVRTC